jgi:DNA uptake protein ComE-like DNA-binding protein
MLNDLLTLTRKEQRGLLVLIVLLGLMLLLRIGLPYLYPPVDFSLLVNDSIRHHWMTLDAPPNAEVNIKGLKAFDPNRIDAQQLMDYGLDSRTASNWKKYLEAGGQFSSVEDIAKLYGMSDEWLNAVTPYINFPIKQSDSFAGNRESALSGFLDLNHLDSMALMDLGWPPPMVDSVLLWQQAQWFPKRYQKKQLVLWTMDSLITIHGNMAPKFVTFVDQSSINLPINQADTADWALLRGVGSVLSRRIVSYRKALGGFVSIDQVAEVYGISPVLFEDIKPYLTLDSIELEAIDVNKASLRRLRNHPYMDYYMARAIVDARQTKGPFASLDQVEELEVFDAELWGKLENYLMVEAPK